MGRYLDKYASTMPTSQARQVLKFLSTLRDQGTIRTTEEYNAQLQKLTTKLKSETLQPLLKLFQAVLGGTIDSASFNAMVQAVQGDLDTAFTEAEDISTTLDLHKNLYKLVVCKALRKAIRELGRTISLYELLDRSEEGYSSGQFNTFDELGHATERTEAIASQLYFDPRRFIYPGGEDDAVVDLYGDRLVLPPEEQKDITVTELQLIEDADTAISKYDLHFPESNMLNMLDGTPYTYWVHPVLLDESRPNGVKMKLRFSLGGAAQEVNLIRIEPALHQPMVLEGLTYVATDGSTVSVDVNATIPSGKETNVYLTAFMAHSITLIFRQDNGENVTYYHQPDRDIWQRANTTQVPSGGDAARLDRISTELNGILANNVLKEACSVPPPPGWEAVSGIQYTFGFDNIIFSSTRYKQFGIFVGEKLTVDKPGVIALKTNEILPSLSLGDSDYQAFSLEYYVMKRNFDASGSFIDSEFFPILPAGEENYVSQERLWLIESSESATNNVLTLRFVPDLSNDPPVIYKNLITQLEIGTHYKVKAGNDDYVETWEEVAVQITEQKNMVTPLVVKIRLQTALEGENQVDPYAFYTAAYAVETDIKLLDYVRLDRSGLTICDINRAAHGVTVASSDLYPVILLRHNYAGSTVTAAIEDYKLLVSSYDKEKYL